MKTEIDPGIAALFGSETRAATLGAVANARQPLTAYRVAQMTGAQVIKVVAELRRLEKAGLVAKTPTDRGRTGWTVSDGALRDLLRRRVRIVWSRDWNEAAGERVRRRDSLPTIRIDLSRYRPNPKAVPNPEEFERPAEKDRLLAKAGLPVSRRSSARR